MTLIFPFIQIPHGFVGTTYMYNSPYLWKLLFLSDRLNDKFSINLWEKKLSSNSIEKRYIGNSQMTYKIVKTYPTIFKTFCSISWTYQHYYRCLSGKESFCQYRRLRRSRFNPWVRKMSCRRKWPPTSIFLPGKSYRQGSGRLQSMRLQRVGHDWVSEHTCQHIVTCFYLQWFSLSIYCLILTIVTIVCFLSIKLTTHQPVVSQTKQVIKK